MYGHRVEGQRIFDDFEVIKASDNPKLLLAFKNWIISVTLYSVSTTIISGCWKVIIKTLIYNK